MAYASVIGSSAVIRGNIRGGTSLEILGRVEGDVAVSGDLALGPDAVVVGTVAGARVTVHGSVEGDVTGSEAVIVGDSGRVIGDLVAPRIGVAEGAFVQGSVRMGPASGAPRAARAQRAEVRAGVPEQRGAPPVPVERTPPRPVAVAAPASTAMASSAALPSPQKAPQPSLQKKAPPPPVIAAPRPGARARKKVVARR